MTTTSSAWRAMFAAAIVALPVSSSAQNPGQQLAEDFRVVTTMPSASDTAFITGHAVGTVDRMRIDVSTGVNSQVSPLTPSGKIGMIVSDSGKTITYLDTQNSTYLTVRPAEMIQQMGAMQMAFTGTKATVDSLGPGPVILGHPTQHYRVGTAMTMNMSAMGQQQVMQFSSTTEYFYATDIKGALNPFASLSGSDMVNMLGGANKEFADKMRSVQAKLPKGTPLRATSSATMTAMGETRVTNTQAEVTSVQWVPADNKQFEVPASYKQSPLPSMSGMGSSEPPPL